MHDPDEESRNFKKALWNEANRVIIDSTYSGRSHQAMGTFWDRLNRWLGIPTVILSALLAGGAGITAIVGTHSWITATLALLSAVLVSAKGFLKPDENAEAHGLKGDRLISLKNDAITFQEVELSSVGNEEILRNMCKELNKRRNGLREMPPRHIYRSVYKRTKESIDAGESDYENDRLWKEYPS
ncbi:MAG: SLATT domain-containing protein [Acidimicrobiales bacterium]|jgi:hypothetical protein